MGRSFAHPKHRLVNNSFVVAESVDPRPCLDEPSASASSLPFLATLEPLVKEWVSEYKTRKISVRVLDYINLSTDTLYRLGVESSLHGIVRHRCTD